MEYLDGLDGLKNPYMDLDQGGKCQAYYIWIDGTKEGLRGKTKTLDKPTMNLADLPVWNFDGSSTSQAEGQNSDVYLKPVAIFKDPFRRGDNILVMCETLTHEMEPHPTNCRRDCVAHMARCEDDDPWFGIEQEYAMFDFSGRQPYGWPENGYPGPQGPYYCGVGKDKVSGRKIVEAHYRCCLYAGINIFGSNAEGMTSQWEYQIGPCRGADLGDHVWVSRWILSRVAEEFNVVISFDPKPIQGDWSGAGAHLNVSTKKTRAPGGLDEIYRLIEILGKKHNEHIFEYDPHDGADNKRRLTGHHETERIDRFSYGVANRCASVRICRQIEREGCGYFEDRRPSSNADPYRISTRMVKTICLGE